MRFQKRPGAACASLALVLAFTGCKSSKPKDAEENAGGEQQVTVDKDKEVAADSQKAQDFFDEGSKAETASEFVKARDLYLKAKTTYPDAGKDATAFRGKVEQRLGGLEEVIVAQQDLQGASGAPDAKKAELEVRYAEALRKRDSLDKAAQQLEDALKIDPTSASAHTTYATVKFESGDLKGSLDQANLALAADQSSAEACYTAAFLNRVAQVDGADPAKTLDLAKKAAAAAPQDPKTHELLAACLKDAGQQDAAVQELVLACKASNGLPRLMKKLDTWAPGTKVDLPPPPEAKPASENKPADQAAPANPPADASKPADQAAPANPPADASKPADQAPPANPPAGDAKPADAKPADQAAPATPPAGDAKPADAKPADQAAPANPPADKPADAKPADQAAPANPPADKPADMNKPADQAAAPAEKPAVDAKPVADTKPAEAAPANPPADASKPADAKPADSKPADAPADAKPAEKPADAKPADAGTPAAADAKPASDAAALAGTWKRSGDPARLIQLDVDAATGDLVGKITNPPLDAAGKPYGVDLRLKLAGTKLEGTAMWTEENPTPGADPAKWTCETKWQLQVDGPDKLSGKCEWITWEQGKVSERGFDDFTFERAKADAGH